MHVLPLALLASLLDAGAAAPPQSPGEAPEPTAASAASMVVAVGELHVGDGRVFTPGEVLVVDGEVREVAASVKAPEGCRRLEHPGSILTPGLVEPAALVPAGRGDGGAGLGAATLDAADAREPFSPWLAGLRAHGVVAACLVPEGGGAIAGRAATVSTDGPGAGGARVLARDVALLASTSSRETGSAGRALARVGLARALEQADDYVKAWTEWTEKQEKDGGSESPGEGRKDAQPETPRLSSFGDRPGRPAVPPRPADGKPRRSEPLEVLKRVVEADLPLRIEARRRADVEAALELARRRKVDVALTGCTECGEVADLVASSRALVILAPLGEPADDDEAGQPDPHLVRRLAEAGARIAISGGGPWPHGAAWLRAAASEAAGQGLPRAQAIAAITGLAAEAAGVGETHGLLAPGRAASFLLWDGDPLDPRTPPPRALDPEPDSEDQDVSAPEPAA